MAGFSHPVPSFFAYPMLMSIFDDKIGALLKPLNYARKDGFAGLRALKGVEGLVYGLCDDLLGECLGDDISSRIKELKELFKGFDKAPEVVKRDTVIKGIGIVESMGVERAEEAFDEDWIEEEVRHEIKGSYPAEVATALERLSTSIEFVKGIGPKLAERFRKKGLCTVEDMLYFFPIRYEDRTRFRKIRELEPGTNAAFACEVMALGEARYGRRKLFEMAVSDSTGILRLKWFNYKPTYMKKYKQGQRLFVYGTVSVFGRNKEMIHPDIEILDGDELADSAENKGIIPVYSQVENLHQKTLRRIVGGVVEKFSSCLIGGVPEGIRKKRGLMELAEAVKTVHSVEGLAEKPGAVELAKKSLVFDELFLLEVGLAIKRTRMKGEPGIAFTGEEGEGGRKKRLEERLRGLLPFALTGAQERILDEIKNDMESPRPMNRLIQGDVGSGKTIVSFISALKAIEAGYQVAIMAPTEILAEQHYLNIHGYAEDLGISPVLLTGSMTRTARASALEEIEKGRADLVIGTHALIQKGVEFSRLGLAIVDEQHRFGVAQRAILKKKASVDGYVSPDMLIMTATPIPRTLSMTVFGDLDVSIIDELPPGRKPVTTRIIRERDRAKAYEVIREELKAGGQAYIVYPLVEESEELSLKDATNMKEHLDTDIFPEFRLGLLHGRMKSAEKEAVMRAFKDGETDILVATTVIEVGVDVPNATVMMVEHAERFGLAQLHQLRGRVGRGVKPASCLLLAQWTRSEDTYRRLRVMEATQDGFRIAEEDLKIRGPGDFLGTRQSGLPGLRLSFALADLAILKSAREDAFGYMAMNPGLKGFEGESIRLVLRSRWAGRLELAEVG